MQSFRLPASVLLSLYMSCQFYSTLMISPFICLHAALKSFLFALGTQPCACSPIPLSSHAVPFQISPPPVIFNFLIHQSETSESLISLNSCCLTKINTYFFKNEGEMELVYTDATEDGGRHRVTGMIM